MKFGRMLKYDLRYGTVRRFGYYLLPLLLGVADAVRQVLNYYKVRNPGTLLDHWLIMTAGTKPYQPNTMHSYKFPTIWLIMQAFMLLVVNGYTSGDLEEHGSVMIVKSRSRAGWWLSKCVWCMFSTLLAYVIYYIPMFLIFAWRGIPMKMHLTKRLVTTSVEGFLNWKTADVCAVVLFIPVAVMMFLCLLQMLLEVVWSPAVAIILLLVIQGISAYKQSVFLWGNWGNPGPYAEDADRVYWQSAVFHSRDHCMHCHRNNTV